MDFFSSNAHTAQLFLFSLLYFALFNNTLGRGSNTIPVSTSTSNNSSRNKNDNRKIRFLQLYTSKSFNSRRDDLLKPDIDDNNNNSYGTSNSNNNAITTNHQNSYSNKHVLSPMLVNAIAKNAQVVWANCQKKEGLLGRSDMRLQTAVGMPGKYKFIFESARSEDGTFQ